MEKSENINEICGAVSKFQSELSGVEKGAENPFFKNKYSTLENIWSTIREPLGKHGLCIFQDVSTEENHVAIATFLGHASGQWLKFSPYRVPLNKKDAQAVGSATTYGKRYSLCAAIGIVSSTEDDDGESAVRSSRGISQSQENALMELIQDDANLLQRILKGYGIKEIRYLQEAEFNKVFNNLKMRQKQ